MSAFSVRVFDRHWGKVLLPAGVEFLPQSWDAEAVGGPSTFEVEAHGDIARLVTLYHWAGYTLWIMSEDNEYIWYGDIEEVEITDGGATVAANLSGVVNRLKVLYADASVGGNMAAAETEWAEDAESIDLYGRRERLHTAREPMRAAQAVQLRDTLLARLSKATAAIGQVSEARTDEGSVALLRGTGFWTRLARVYYKNDNGQVEHTEGGTRWPLGMGFTSSAVSFVNEDDNAYKIHQAYGRLKHFTVPDLQLSVTGAAQSANNRAFTVTGSDGKEAVSITKTSISFEPADDIHDTSLSLGPIAAGDVIIVSGAVNAANNGAHEVKSAVKEHIEISPGFAGGNLVNEAAGAGVNIVRGNSVTVTEATVDERAGASVTVTAHGQRIAQSFRTNTSGAWTLARVEIHLRKVGAPTDSVRVRLRADSAGTPTGAILDSINVDDSLLESTEEGTWVEFVMPAAVTLNPSTLYWLEILRDGANDSDNFYEVWVDESAGYANGTVQLYTGTSYVAPVKPLSVCFRLVGGVDTAVQVTDICKASDVFADAIAQDLSGLKTSQYRDGTLFSSDQTAELLDTGDGSNVRLLASVNPQRFAIIRTQPDKSTAKYIWRKGSLFTLQGTPVPKGLLPVGEWCYLDNTSLLEGALADASPFFIEYAQYREGSGWTLRAAAEPDPWQVGMVRDG